jgi:hypothetical protein
MFTRAIKASPVKVTGTDPDDRPFEAFLEEEFFVWLRFRQDVESFERPKEPIPWRDETGKNRKYTPDAIVRWRPKVAGGKGSTEVCEVKPDFERERDTPAGQLPRRESDEDNEMKWEAARLWAESRGWTFRVYRSTDIRGPFLQNAKFLLKYVEREFPDLGSERLLRTLHASGPVALEALMEKMEPDAWAWAKLLPTLYVQIVRGAIDADLNQPLTNGTILRVADGS